MYFNQQDGRVMKARFIILTENGFVCADWVNGRTYPECFGFDTKKAQTFTQSRAEILETLCIDNGMENVKLIKIL
jgi:hypothetical protein